MKKERNPNIPVHGNNKLTKPLLLKAINKTGGNIANICRVLKVSRPTVYHNLKNFDLGDAVKEARVALRDRALETIEDNIDDVDVALKYLSIATRFPHNTLNVKTDENVVINVLNVEAKNDLDSVINEL